MKNECYYDQFDRKEAWPLTPRWSTGARAATPSPGR